MSSDVCCEAKTEEMRISAIRSLKCVKRAILGVLLSFFFYEKVICKI